MSHDCSICPSAGQCPIQPYVRWLEDNQENINGLKQKHARALTRVLMMELSGNIPFEYAHTATDAAMMIFEYALALAANPDIAPMGSPKAPPQEIPKAFLDAFDKGIEDKPEDKL